MIANAAGLGSTTVCFWVLVRAIIGAGAGVSLPAWWWLYVLSIVVATIASRFRWPTAKRPGWWLMIAGYCVLGALFFFGADQGLDALNGVGRKKAAVAESLGGIELWFVLVPAFFSIAVGGCVRAALKTHFINRSSRDTSVH